MTTKNPYATAQRHLQKSEPILADLIGRIGRCTLQPDPRPFPILVASIISQQISTKAAISIRGKLETWCGKSGLIPSRIAKATDEDLQSCGISTSKRKSLRSLSECFLRTRNLSAKLLTMPDDEVSDTLLPVHGIGPWTVQMFLIFSLGRLDVWPTADLGLRMAVQELFQYEEIPATAELNRLAEPWKPYRSIATWYFWRSRGEVPQSE